MLVFYFLIEPLFLAEVNAKRSANMVHFYRQSFWAGTVAQKEILTYDKQFITGQNFFLCLSEKDKGDGAGGLQRNSALPQVMYFVRGGEFRPDT